jgi:hypothetical protein
LKRRRSGPSTVDAIELRGCWWVIHCFGRQGL